MALPENASIPQNGSLIARWKLDETSGTRSDSAASFDLTDNNTVLYSATPQFDANAADFEAADTDSLSHADAAGLTPTGDVTWSCWMKWESVVQSGIFTKWSGTTERGYIVWYNAGSLNVYLSTTGSDQLDTGVSFTPVAGNWYHFTWTFDISAGEVRTYVNGQQQGTTQTTGTTAAINDETNTFYLGGEGSVTAHFDGLMQDAMMWNALLSSAEVEDLYNAYFNLPDEGDLPVTPISRWTLTEDGGTRYDSVGSNHLTDTNTVLSATGIDEVNASAERAADFEEDNSESLQITDANQTGLDIAGDISFAVWVYVESLAQIVIMMKHGTSGASENGYRVEVLVGGEVRFLSYDSSDNQNSLVTTGTPITAGSWFHIAVAIDTSEADGVVYINGVAEAMTNTTQTSSTIQTNAKPFVLGVYDADGTPSEYFDGKMQDAMIFNSILTAQNVTDLYELYTVAATFRPQAIVIS